MELILLEKIHNLGDLGEKVSVKPGFARNFLIPKGKAVSATEDNVKRFEVKKAELQAKENEKLTAAQKKAEGLTDKTISLTVRVGPQGKLYGSVSTTEVVDAITAMGVEVDKKHVRIVEDPIRELGEFNVEVRFHADVLVTCPLHVTASAASDVDFDAPEVADTPDVEPEVEAETTDVQVDNPSEDSET